VGHRRFAADAANVQPGMTVAVVGDGTVGLSVLSGTDGCEAHHRDERHETRQAGPSSRDHRDRAGESVARIKELTDGIGADAVLRVSARRVDDPAIVRPVGGVGTSASREAKLDFISPGGAVLFCMSVSMAAPPVRR
jgi:threonine dehydrogenase-like Zn-dependent dehydrogenase